MVSKARHPVGSGLANILTTARDLLLWWQLTGQRQSQEGKRAQGCLPVFFCSLLFRSLQLLKAMPSLHITNHWKFSPQLSFSSFCFAHIDLICLGESVLDDLRWPGNIVWSTKCSPGIHFFVNKMLSAAKIVSRQKWEECTLWRPQFSPSYRQMMPSEFWLLHFFQSMENMGNCK